MLLKKGRYSTGAFITAEVTRIELSFLLKQKYIQKTRVIRTSLSWTNGNEVSFTSIYTDSEAYIQLHYNHSPHEDIQNLKYKIYLAKVPSNLGKGEVLYFLCPVTHQKCRVLYLCYGSLIFKSRKAYNNRIYYSEQISSNLEKPNDIYWKLQRRIDKMDLKYHKPFYKGKLTKKEKKLES